MARIYIYIYILWHDVWLGWQLITRILFYLIIIVIITTFYEQETNLNKRMRVESRDHKKASSDLVESPFKMQLVSGMRERFFLFFLRTGSPPLIHDS